MALYIKIEIETPSHIIVNWDDIEVVKKYTPSKLEKNGSTPFIPNKKVDANINSGRPPLDMAKYSKKY